MAYLKPGQGFKKFAVAKMTKGLTASGKSKEGMLVETGTIIGILATATEKEQDVWKQKGHPVSHKIVQAGIGNKAIATNYLILAEPDKKTRFFYVQSTGNPGGLNHMMRYYVEERDGLNYGQGRLSD